MPILKGYNHKKGIYQEKEYDNYTCFFYDEFGPEENKWFFQKIKKKVFDDNKVFIDDLVGHDLSLAYDRWQNVVNIYIQN